MNSSTIKLLVTGMLLLFLSACAPYQQAYYPAGGAYNGYGFTQRNYYGGYPYNNNYYDDDDEHHHFDRHNGFNSNPSWNNGYVRPNPSNGYPHNHPDRKHQKFGYQGSVPSYPDHNDHHEPLGNNNWSRPPSDRPWEHTNNPHDRPNSYVQNDGQNHRGDDRRNQIKEQQQYDQEKDNRDRYENHGQTKNQRENRRRNHYQ